MADENKKYPKELPETSDLVKRQFLDRMIGDMPMEDGIVPVESPIDLVAGAAGAKLGQAMARDAAAIVGNEIGAVGADIMAAAGKLPKGWKAAADTGKKSVVHLQHPEHGLVSIQPSAAGSAFEVHHGGSLAGLKGVKGSFANPQEALQHAVQYIDAVNARTVIPKTPGPGIPGMADGGEVSGNIPDFLPDDAMQASVGMSQSPTMGQDMSQLSSSSPQSLPDFIPDEQFKPDVDQLQEQFGTPTEIAKTFAEGVGQGLVGPVAPLAEQALGVAPEDILKRAEANPLAHYGGELAGLAGGLLTGTGVGGLAAKTGGMAAKALGVTAEAGLAAKVGSQLVRGAIENMVVQGSDEVSRAVLMDPNQTAETALLDIGLAGAIGGVLSGGITAASPLWKATAGKNASHFLNSMTSKLGGIEGQAGEEAIEAAIKESGLEIAPEIRAAISADPAARQTFQLLQESTTSGGLKAQQALKDFKQITSEATVRTLGRTPEELASLSEMSDFDAGSAVKKQLIDDLKKMIDPVSEKFNVIKERFKGQELGLTAPSRIADQISSLVREEGYALSPSSPQFNLINTTMKELPNIRTLEDLRRYQSILRDKTANPELRRIGAQLKNILRDAEEEAVTEIIGKEAPLLIDEHKIARTAYKDSMSLIDNLNDRLRVGHYSGPTSFLKALSDMAPEDVLRRLSPKNDAGIIAELAPFSNVSNTLKNYYLDKTLKTAVGRGGEEALSLKTLFNSLDKMSPEMRNFVVSPEQQSKLNAIKALVEGIPNKMNTSGTAKTLDLLWSRLPASAGALAGYLHGKNPITGAVLGHLGRIVAREVPDAVRLGMLKFMGTPKPVDAAGFKAMTDYIAAATKGYNMISKSVKSVFDMKTPLPSYAMAKNDDIEKLDKRIQKIQQNPEIMYASQSDLGYYMPEHDEKVAQNLGSILTFLAGARPKTSAANPLDKPAPIPAAQKADYNKILKVAQQPLSVLAGVKSGAVSMGEVQAMQMMYPALYKKLVTDLTTEMNNAMAKGNPIPYATRLGMSKFLGRPLDMTMTPQGIANAQPLSQPAPEAATATREPGYRPSAPALQKMPNQYRTPAQARQTRMQRTR